MYRQYGDRVQFLLIYIKEAHPNLGWSEETQPGIRFLKDPANLMERMMVANSCATELDISFPTLVDDMENTAATAYKSFPDRLYLVGRDGHIAYTSPPGPGGFLPHKLEEAIVLELGEPDPR